MCLKPDSVMLLIVDGYDGQSAALALVVEVIEARGCRVVTVSSGQEALDRAHQVRPDLILLNTMLSGEDSFAICRRFKSDAETRNIPIIFMTPDASIEHRSKCFAAGCIDYISMPLHIDEVLARVTPHLEQRELESLNIALRESEQRYREIFENAIEGMYLLEVTEDERFRYLDINPARAAAVGISRKEMIGRYVDDCMPEEVGRQVVEKYRRCLAEGETVTESITLDLPGGSRHYTSTITPIYHQGRIHRLIGITSDITESKRMEVVLADQEREYRTLVESLPDNVMRYNLAGRTVYCNPNCSRVLPLPIDEVLGKTPCETFPGVDYIVTYQQVLQRVIASGRPEKLQVEVLGPDGAMQIHQISLVAERCSKGNICGALAIGSDITALIEAERQLSESNVRLRKLLAQRESDSNDERRRIAREVHDELGQVLTALKLGISTFRMALGREHQAFEAKVTGLLQLTDKAICTVRAVVSSLRPTALDMGIVQALHWLMDEFEHHSGASCHLNLSTSLDGIDDLHAMTVFRTVQEALTNTTRHAEACLVTIDINKQPDGTCLLEIRDDGKGFDPSTEVAGHFGLIGMHERIDSLGGTLVIDSAPGAGTCIRISIPEFECTEEYES